MNNKKLYGSIRERDENFPYLSPEGELWTEHERQLAWEKKCEEEDYNKFNFGEVCVNGRFYRPDEVKKLEDDLYDRQIKLYLFYFVSFFIIISYLQSFF